MLRKIAKSLRRHHVYLLEAFVLVVFAWLINMAPMRIYTRVLGHRTAINSQPVTDTQIKRAVRITRAIRFVSRHVPFKAVCIEETIAASLALRVRRIPATAFIGVHKDREQRVPDADGHNAHAWLKVGDYILIGGPNVSGYVPLVSFA